MTEQTSHDDIRRLFPGEVLTDLQIGFARAYNISGVGMRSIREAGYELTTAGAQSAASNRLLKNPKVKRLLTLLKDGDIR
mgnify:CR=1 FL=1